MTSVLQKEARKTGHSAASYLLFTQLQLATSFLKTASSLPSADKKHYEWHALRIYREVSDTVLTTDMPTNTREALKDKLSGIRKQVVALGYEV